MKSEIEQWFHGDVAPIDYKPQLFKLDKAVIQHNYLVDYGNGHTENISSQCYKTIFKEQNGSSKYLLRLSDKAKLIEVLDAIESAIRTDSVQRYALSEWELFPNEEGEFTFLTLENRVRALYTLYLCHRVLIWHSTGEMPEEEVTREDFGSAYLYFYWQEDMQKYLQKMALNEGKASVDLEKMPLYERAKLIIRDIAQEYLKDKITVEFAFEEILISKRRNGKEDKQKKKILVEKYVCDSLFTALLMQIMRYIQLGEDAKRHRKIKMCEQCHKPFFPKKSNTRYCPECGSGAKRQERYLKAKKEAE